MPTFITLSRKGFSDESHIWINVDRIVTIENGYSQESGVPEGSILTMTNSYSDAPMRISVKESPLEILENRDSGERV